MLPGGAEDRGSFAEAEVCGDDHAGSLIEFAQEVEEHRSARRAERPALIDCFAINCRAVGIRARPLPGSRCLQR